MQRNDQLRNDIRILSEKMRREVEDENMYRDFHTLKENYWVMVRNTFPIWYEEQQQYEQRYGSPRPSASGVQASPRLSNASPRQGRSQAVSSHFPVPRSPRVSQASPRMSNRSPQASPRPHSSRMQPTQQSHETIESQETLTVPPLELDFSMGDDPTTASQLSASALKHKAIGGVASSGATPKSALASSSSKAKNKKVQIKDEKKALKEQKKAAEKAAKAEKERQKQLEKEKKKKRDSARSGKHSAISPRSDKGSTRSPRSE